MLRGNILKITSALPVLHASFTTSGFFILGAGRSAEAAGRATRRGGAEGGAEAAAVAEDVHTALIDRRTFASE